MHITWYYVLLCQSCMNIIKVVVLYQQQLPTSALSANTFVCSFMLARISTDLLLAARVSTQHRIHST